MGLGLNCLALEYWVPLNKIPQLETEKWSFPPEILHQIFSYFSQISPTSGKVAHVCIQWRQQINDHVLAKRELAQVETLTYKDLLKWKKCFKHRYSIEISNVLLLNYYCKQLFTLDCSNSKITDDTLKKISYAQLKNLKYLNLSNCRYLKAPDLSRFNKQIESVDLSNCDQLTVPILPQVPHLRNLNLLGCENLKLSIEEISKPYQHIYIQYPNVEDEDFQAAQGVIQLASLFFRRS